MSIYLEGNCRQRGIGRQLYLEMEKRLLRQNVFNVYAGVTASDRKDDAFVTDASIRFHERMGYTKVGEYRLCGYKFGQWYSVIWLGKTLGDRPEKPEPFIPFPALEEYEEK
jgi:phosphinothricin acetyltransferase